MPLRLVFAGTPAFAVPCLEVCQGHGSEVLAVYTQPDRPAGRGRKLTQSPVKQAAQTALLPVEQPASLKSIDVQERLAAYAPDLMVVVAYGLMLPRSVLAVPRLGCWNVHASLLPRWRGAAPVQRAMLAGDSETGVCLMRMEAALDSGPVLLEKRTPIMPDDNGGTLHDRLTILAAQVLKEGLIRTLSGTLLPAVAQSDKGITYAHKLDKAESALDVSRAAHVLERQVRAFNPWPGSYVIVKGEQLRIWVATVLEMPHAAPPGSLLAASSQGLDLACAQGVLRITCLQRAGGRRITAADYLNARPELRRLKSPGQQKQTQHDGVA